MRRGKRRCSTGSGRQRKGENREKDALDLKMPPWSLCLLVGAQNRMSPHKFLSYPELFPELPKCYKPAC